MKGAFVVVDYRIYLLLCIYINVLSGLLCVRDIVV